MNGFEQNEITILKLFVNEYMNIDEITQLLKISEDTIVNVLDKYDELKKHSITELYIDIDN